MKLFFMYFCISLLILPGFFLFAPGVDIVKYDPHVEQPGSYENISNKNQREAIEHQETSINSTNKVQYQVESSSMHDQNQQTSTMNSHESHSSGVNLQAMDPAETDHNKVVDTEKDTTLLVDHAEAIELIHSDVKVESGVIVEPDIFEDTVDNLDHSSENIARQMKQFIPEEETVLTNGLRQDGSNYVLTVNKSGKNEIITVFEFDEKGYPVFDEQGVHTQKSFNTTDYKNQLTSSRDVLLKKAQEDLREFNTPENIKVRQQLYDQQKLAYDKAESTMNVLKSEAEKDSSVQKAYEESVRIFNQENVKLMNTPSPDAIIAEMERNVYYYSDKQTKVNKATQELQEAQNELSSIKNKKQELQKQYQNQKDKTSSASVDLLQEISKQDNLESTYTNIVKSKNETLTYEKQKKDIPEYQIFDVVLDQITAEFVQDPEIIDSLQGNKDYHNYKDKVSDAVYQQGTVQKTVSGLRQTIKFMADIDLGKVIRPLKKIDIGKPFRTLAQDAKYAYLGKSRYQA